MSDKLGCACDEGIRAAANMGFAIAGVPCFADTFVQGGSSVLRTKFCAKTPRHRKTPIRYDPLKEKLKYYLNFNNKETV